LGRSDAAPSALSEKERVDLLGLELPETTAFDRRIWCARGQEQLREVPVAGDGLRAKASLTAQVAGELRQELPARTGRSRCHRRWNDAQPSQVTEQGNEGSRRCPANLATSTPAGQELFDPSPAQLTRRQVTPTQPTAEMGHEVQVLWHCPWRVALPGQLSLKAFSVRRERARHLRPTGPLHDRFLLSGARCSEEKHASVRQDYAESLTGVRTPELKGSAPRTAHSA